MDKDPKAEEQLPENATTSDNVVKSTKPKKVKRNKRKFKFPSFLTNAFSAIKAFRLPIPSCLLNCIAFGPPVTSEYQFVRKKEETNPLKYFVTIMPSIATHISVDKVERMLQQSDGFYLESPPSMCIACVHMRNTFRQPAPMFVILSHLNACDMALGMEYADLLCSNFGIDVFMYDYPGYGLSKGRPTENGLYRSHDLIYKYMTTELKIPPKKIILIGISIGTVPAIDLASRKEVGCLIVISAFTSAYGAICPNSKWNCFKDRLCNSSKIKNVKFPTLIVHGANDEMFDLTHAIQLAENCPVTSAPVVIPGASHNDVSNNRQTLKIIAEFLNRNCHLMIPVHRMTGRDVHYASPEYFAQLYAKLNDAELKDNEQSSSLSFSTVSFSGEMEEKE
ncbi:Alpha/beta hydrolase domain-containing protein 17A [Trichinella sp. T8]|nr:Alpha/beta hydrolase domain-containing protein 17A [Trichinella sp. T8]